MSIFTETQHTKPPYSTFDLSHQVKLTGKAGELIPILVEEVVPGDVWNISTANLTRMVPMLAPLMHQVNVFTHGFFVPNRLLWEQWEDFITGGPDGDKFPAHPKVSLNKSSSHPMALMDYMGIPFFQESQTDFLSVNALPFAAYFLIYNEYYRDQNLINEIPYKAVSGNVQDTEFLNACRGDCLKRAWQHDYFTSALPWTQRGPEATIPLGNTADIFHSSSGSTSALMVDLNGDPIGGGWSNVSTVAGNSGTIEVSNGGSTQVADWDVSKNHFVDLSSATAATINELRAAFALQQFLEKNARGGSRLIEVIHSHFGVVSSDARLQRPEYIGGGANPIAISEVLQTSSTDETTPQGNMAGHGISAGQTSRMRYAAEEHGWIMVILSVMPKTAYQDGLHRKWFRADKFDYYWPSFAQLGEQPIYKKEVNVNHIKPDDEFGYTPRYSEYKYINDRVCGLFREKGDDANLSFWSWHRVLNNTVALNKQFIECLPSTRIFAVTDTEEHFYMTVYNGVRARRCMPYFGTPKIIV